MEKHTSTQETVRGQNVFEWYEALISAALVLVLVFSLFFRIIQVDGESMVPTLQNGDKLIVWGAGYAPQRGDVVIVDSYTAYGKPLVKRVIARGGDVVNIDYQAGTVSVNGEVLQEAYIAEPTYLGYDVTFPYTVPEGTVFVMGATPRWTAARPMWAALMNAIFWAKCCSAFCPFRILGW